MWVASRVVVVCTTYVAVFLPTDEGWQTWQRLLGVLATRWDGEYYLRIAQDGYPHVLPTAADRLTHHWGFYPLFPWLAAALSRLTTLHVGTCALLLNTVLGALSPLLLGRWLRRHLDATRTLWAVAFFCFWTQSYFFTYAYAEALYLVVVCALLLLLDAPRGFVWPAHGALVFVLGLLGGLTRPYTALVALALFLGNLSKLPRDNLLRTAWVSRLLWANILCGAGAGLALIFVWWGNCWLHTGIWDNCTVRAWEVGWDYGTATLPEALARDVVDLMTRRPFHMWHLVMGWEVAAWVLSVGVFVRSFSLVRTMGVTPVVLATLPLLVNTALPHIDAVPRYLATTPTLFILLSAVHDRPVARAVVMGAVLALHVMSSTATAMGVWQSF